MPNAAKHPAWGNNSIVETDIDYYPERDASAALGMTLLDSPAKFVLLQHLFLHAKDFLLHE